MPAAVLMLMAVHVVFVVLHRRRYLVDIDGEDFLHQRGQFLFQFTIAIRLVRRHLLVEYREYLNV